MSSFGEAIFTLNAANYTCPRTNPTCSSCLVLAKRRWTIIRGHTLTILHVTVQNLMTRKIKEKSFFFKSYILGNENTINVLECIYFYFRPILSKTKNEKNRQCVIIDLTPTFVRYTTTSNNPVFQTTNVVIPDKIWLR